MAVHLLLGIPHSERQAVGANVVFSSHPKMICNATELYSVDSITKNIWSKMVELRDINLLFTVTTSDKIKHQFFTIRVQKIITAYFAYEHHHDTGKPVA